MTQLSLQLWDDEDMNDSVETENIVRCKRCHRILKNPKHIELGFGLTCYRKYLAETRKCKKLFEVKES